MALLSQVERNMKTKTELIINFAQKIADETKGMFKKRGPGEGNRFTTSYMNKLDKLVAEKIGLNYVEQTICGKTRQSVDFYVREDKTVIEVELSLYNVHTNLDRDIFKVLLAKDAGEDIQTLLLIGKEPARERHNQPASRALIDWVLKHHRLNVIIKDITKPSHSI